MAGVRLRSPRAEPIRVGSTGLSTALLSIDGFPIDGWRDGIRTYDALPVISLGNAPLYAQR